MELDLTWVLLGLPLAFVGGWLASRFDIRQWRLENRSAPKSYFKGLNFLLNAQQDEAIDAFIEAVQQDPDTSELHFALGNLFRSRGDYDRAVRVHQHLLQRADLSGADHERAQHALALDFTRAGLLDRAEVSLRLLMGTPYEAEAQITLLALYERTNDWGHAIEVAEQLALANRGSFNSRMAHYQCELARDARQVQNMAAAKQHLKQALVTCPGSARARLDLAQLLADEGAFQTAYEHLEALSQLAPSALPLAAGRLADLSIKVGKQTQATLCLANAQSQHPSMDYVEALAGLLPQQDSAAQSKLCLDHLQKEPSLVVATRWLTLQGEAATGSSQVMPPLPPEVSKALVQATDPLKRYRCAACGFEAVTHFWQCPGCQTWDSYSPRRVGEL